MEEGDWGRAKHRTSRFCYEADTQEPGVGMGREGGKLPHAKFYLLEPSSKKWVPYQEIRFVTYKRFHLPRVCRQGGPNKALASSSRSFTWTLLHR